MRLPEPKQFIPSAGTTFLAFSPRGAMTQISLQAFVTPLLVVKAMSDPSGDTDSTRALSRSPVAVPPIRGTVQAVTVVDVTEVQEGAFHPEAKLPETRRHERKCPAVWAGRATRLC